MAAPLLPRRHFVIPDTQIRPGVPTDHIDWIARYCVEQKPDVIVVLGDFWDFPSLNSHEEKGSLPTEGARYLDDIKAGNEAFARLCKPIEAETARLHKNHDARWRPEKHFLMGNHEDRADRAAIQDPKYLGHIGSENCDTRDFKRHPFLERVWIDGICYSHYFQNSHSSRPIGGGVENRLAKVGSPFVQGHEQGFKPGSRDVASGGTWRGIIAGSCYLHIEAYRGRQGQDHWRGIVVLNEVENGRFSCSDVTLRWLCDRYEGVRLQEYMDRKYPYQGWEYLA